MATDDLGIEALFGLASEEAWRALVESSLRGEPYESLIARSEDGIALKPLYRAAKDAVPIGRAGGVPWRPVQRLDHPDPAAANRAARIDSTNGAGGLALVFAGAPSAHGLGLAVGDLDDLDRALADIDLGRVALRLEAGAVWRGAAALFAALGERRNLDPAAVEIHFGIDPLGAFGAQGTMAGPWREVAASLGDTAAEILARGFGGTIALTDGRPWHAGGASDGQELAVVLANAVAMLRALDDAGLDLEEASRRIGLALAVDQDQFGAIAKVRALRKLWAAVRAECGLPEAAAHVHAETAWRMMTRRDAYTNMVRTTIATFAAGVGGADSITVLPFTVAIGLPDTFARRIARNTHTILIEESHLAGVVDPGAGSGAVEARTDALAGTAWELFREIEREGGLAAAIENGSVQARIAAAREERARRFAEEERVIIGTTRYPAPADATVETEETPQIAPKPATGRLGEVPAARDGAAFRALVAGASAGATLADFAALAEGGETRTAAPLDPMRLSEPFEA